MVQIPTDEEAAAVRESRITELRRSRHWAPRPVILLRTISRISCCRVEPCLVFLARLMMLAFPVVLLTGCAPAPPSVIIVSPFYALYVVLFAMLQFSIRLLRNALELTWGDLYDLIRRGISSAAVGIYRKSRAVARQILAEPAGYLRDLGKLTVKVLKWAAIVLCLVVFGAIFYAACIVAFVVVELPLWLTFWAWFFLRQLYYRVIKRTKAPPSDVFNALRRLATVKNMKTILVPTWLLDNLTEMRTADDRRSRIANILSEKTDEDAVLSHDTDPTEESTRPEPPGMTATPPDEQQAGTNGAASAECFLLAQLPARVPKSADVSLVVRVTRDPSAFPATASAGLPGLEISPGGVPVTLVVQAPSDLLPLGPLEQVIWVPLDVDPSPVRFAFRARKVGLQRILVTSWAGGTFLAELRLEVSVEDGAPYVDAPARAAPLGTVEAEPGEVTLHVRFDGERYMFQLLSEQYPFEPVLAEAVTAQPSEAIERMTTTLRGMAIGGARGGYSASNARRWMEQAGVGLWNDMVPDLIKEQFWQLRGHVTAFTIAASRDIVPWELLYPLSKSCDEGFLVEQFPVMRLVYGQQRVRNVTIEDPRYVITSRSPRNAEDEIASIRAILGQASTDAKPIVDLSVLLQVIESGRSGMLHFCCHNTFATDDGGSSITMEGGPLVPLLLNKAVNRRTLAQRHPLIFINACRSAGTVPEYTHMMGWAQQFMAAGAGAFAGTLWAVRSESASRFADAFYGALNSGSALGDACRLARMEAARDTADPTWLAYTIYGHPAARAVRG